MSNQTIKGIVENGKIRLTENVALPEGAKVLVRLADSSQIAIRTPRLANPSQAADFV
jgi:uncharacterized lipoprotein YbaY